MATRAAICIGVDRAGTMPALQAAAKGAKKFEEWAKTQECDTTLLCDDGNAKVALVDIFDAVKTCVDARKYEQLIIYFSGHGILSAPGVEYWLLSRAPENANEAVNLFRSVEDARNSGIPHVVFVSDACRSCVNGPPLSGVSGGTIFPNTGFVPERSRIDVFYATRPGDPAWEVPQDKSTQNYRGIFTEFLLDAVKAPQAALVDDLEPGTKVIASIKLQPYLESLVPERAADLDVRIRQTPELRVESSLPKYFAKVDPASVVRPKRLRAPQRGAVPTLESALGALRDDAFDSQITRAPSRDADLAAHIGLTGEVRRLEAARGRASFETRTGFTVHGAKPLSAHANGWDADPAFSENDAWQVRLRPGSREGQPSVVLTYASANGVIRGAILPVMDEFIGIVVIDEAGRVISVHFVPSRHTPRYQAYERHAARIEKMRAYAAVAARNGRFEVPQETAGSFAARIRIDKALDPALGLYAAYAYAQVGRDEDVKSVYHYMKDDPSVPVPFDVVMLATRSSAATDDVNAARYSPFAPLLSQGWALLAPGDRMYRPIHDQLRPHLVPSLWTTLNEQGAEIARQFVQSGGRT